MRRRNQKVSHNDDDIEQNQVRGRDARHRSPSANIFRKTLLWIRFRWREGNTIDKAVLLLAPICLFSLLFTVVDVRFVQRGGMHLPKISVHHPSIQYATIAGYKIPVNNTAGFIPDVKESPTIHIPMEQIPDNEGPQRVELRNWEVGLRKELRRTGEEALLQYGIQLRHLMALGGNILQNHQTSPQQHEDSKDSEVFRHKLAHMAPWLMIQEDSASRAGVTAKNKNWPFNTLPEPSDNPKSRAVVLSFGDKQLKYADTLMRTIRLLHKSRMPIRVVYKGNSDLSQISRDILTEKYFIGAGMGGLQFIDLTTIFNLQVARLDTWNLKAFAMLAVAEQQVLLLDVDVMLLQPPEVFFEQKGYLKTGALFFRDRSHREHLWTPRQFLLAMQPRLSSMGQTALTNGNLMNEHIQEAGAVLIDKNRRRKGLWAACLILGRPDVRRFIQRDMVYGDKEVYFTAFETVDEPYEFAKYYPGTIGSIVTDFSGNDLEWGVGRLESKNLDDLQFDMALCGRMLHFDDNGMPLWSNGGYYTREDDRKADNSIASQGLHPVLFADGGNSLTEEGGAGKEDNQNWLENIELAVLCLYPNARKIRQVPAETTERGRMAVEYYLRILNQTAEDVLVRKS